MKSYSKTYTYALFDKEFHIANAVSKLDIEKFKIDPALLQLHLINIEKTITIPTKKLVLSDFAAGNIIPFIADASVELPATIPIFLIKSGNASIYKALINLTSFATIEKDATGKPELLKIDDKKLFVLMHTASFYRRWAVDSNVVTMSNSFVKVCANSYARLMYKVLDKEYAVGASFEDIDRCNAALAYFFASYHVDSKYAKDIASTIAAIVDKRVAKEYLESIKVTSFTGFEDFVNFLKSTISSLKYVDPQHIVSAYARIWNGPSVPAIDYFPYFIHVIGSAYIGADFAKDILVNSTIRTDADDIVKLLSTLYS